MCTSIPRRGDDGWAEARPTSRLSVFHVLPPPNASMLPSRTQKPVRTWKHMLQEQQVIESLYSPSYSSSDSVRPADGGLLAMLLSGPPGTTASCQLCPCDQDERSAHRPPMNRMRRPTTFTTSCIYIIPGSFFSFPSTDLLKAHPHNNILENLFLS